MRTPLLLTVLFSTACYSPTFKEGLPCSETRQCPGDQVCAADDRCYSEDPGADAGGDGDGDGDGDGGMPACNSRIAYTLASEDGLQSDIIIRKSDSTDPINVTQQDSNAFSPDWSNAGLLVFGLSVADKLVIVTSPPAAGATPTVVSNEASNTRTPVWSPPSDRVLFSAISELVVVDGGGGNRKTPFTGLVSAGQYVWSPDGSRIAFTSSSNIFTVQPDGNALVNLSNSGDASNPAWSPDGATIAHTRSSDIFGMGADGSGAVNLTNQPSTDTEARWSPDGRLLFRSDRTGSFELFVMNQDGSGLFQLTDDGSNRDAVLAAWSPDSRRVAFVREPLLESDPMVLYSIEVETRSETVIDPNLGGFTNRPSWEPCPSD